MVPASSAETADRSARRPQIRYYDTMTPLPPRFDKRTVLGGQYLAVGAALALPPGSITLATMLGAVGTYLVFGRKRGPARTVSSKFLLHAK